MVKNSTGGNKAKGLARKNLNKKEGGLRTAKEEGEIYAQTIKVMGGNIANAVDLDGNPLIVHIRGKFRGRGKRDNFIGPNTWLLVGLHEWCSKTGQRNCDVLEVYNESDKLRLKTSLNSVDWSKFIDNDNKMIGSTETNKHDDIVFTDDITQEYEEFIEKDVGNNPTASNAFVYDDSEQINVDDI